MDKKSIETLGRLANQITFQPKKRMGYFKALPLTEQSAVFNILSPQMRQEILRQLSLNETIDLLDYLDLQRVHHILGKMKNLRRRNQIITRLKNDLYSKIEQFLQFHPQASIALFHLNYVFLPETTTISETASIIEDHLHNTGKVPEIIVNRNGEVVGEVSFCTLVREMSSSQLGKHIEPIDTLFYNSNQPDIIALLTSKPHKKIVVLDSDKSVLGIIYSDDIIDLLGESPAASLYSFAGVKESERPFDNAWSKVKHRYKWLILNLGTAFFAGTVVNFFGGTLTQVVLLTMYIPIVASMGGNAATQTFAVMVRGIAVGEIALRNSKKAILREILAGFTNGTITGFLALLVALFLKQDPLIGLVVGLSIISSLVVAGLAGTIIPLTLKYFGKDPATSATVFITTATDVSGLLVFLGLSTLILL